MDSDQICYTATFWPDVRHHAAGGARALPWATLLARVESPKPPASGAKDDNPLWSFATFDGARHADATFLYTDAVPLDFDSDAGGKGNPGLTADDLRRALGNVRHLAHTTWSHAPGAARWRAIVLLSRAVTRDEYAVLCDHVAALFAAAGVGGLDADPSWRQPSRWFFVPLRRGEYQGYGTPPDVPPLDVDSVLAERERAEAEAELATWEVPQPLGDECCDVPFPSTALPAPLARVVELVTRAYQVPRALPASVALGVLAGAAGGRGSVELNAGWVEPLVLWTCTVLAPGERKSPVVRVLRGRLDAAERAVREAAMAEREEAKAKLAGLKAREKKAKGPDAEALAKEIAQVRVPAVPTWHASDATPEAVAGALAENGGSLLWLSAEGVAFQHMAGLYRDGAANLDVFLNGYDGDPVRVLRRGVAGNLDIPHAHLCVCVTIQPSVLAEARGRPELGGRGVLQRFLWSVPRGRVGTRDADAPALPADFERLWGPCVERMVAAREAPSRLVLSSGAADTLRAYRVELEAAMAPGGPLAVSETLQGWASKQAGRVARIAGVLHLATGAPGYTVPVEIMSGAIEIGRYYQAHALHALTSASLGDAARLARRILAWLARKPEIASFAQRAAQVQLSTPGLEAEAVGSACRYLRSRGYLREVVPAAPSPRGGRPAGPAWAVNPRWTRAPGAPTQPANASTIGTDEVS